MQKTQNGLRKKITFVGQTNSGKSSLINAIVGDKVSIVSEVKGTTTDSITRAYEILGFGPVLLCDTAGFGDTTALGQEREKASFETLKNSDLAVLVLASPEPDAVDMDVLKKIQQLNLPFIIVYNKNDLYQVDNNVISTNALTKKGVDLLVKEVAKMLENAPEQKLLSGIVKAQDRVLLVMPQDSSAPKGRLILPQVQMIRELLDMHAMPTCVALEELEVALNTTAFDLVITDSQVVKQVLERIPSTQRVTTFSVLFARMKGDFKTFLEGVKAIDTLQDGDKILIAEACVHTTREDDIAKAMIPKIMQKRTGKNLIFEYAHGKKLPDCLSQYKLILQCGGCMLTPKEVQNRIADALTAGTAITNFGLAITKCQVGHIDRLTY